MKNNVKKETLKIQVFKICGKIVFKTFSTSYLEIVIKKTTRWINYQYMSVKKSDVLAYVNNSKLVHTSSKELLNKYLLKRSWEYFFWKNVSLLATNSPFLTYRKSRKIIKQFMSKLSFLKKSKPITEWIITKNGWKSKFKWQKSM